MIEAIFEFVRIVALVFTIFFGTGIFLLWGCFPVNDRQDQAPFWLLAAFCKRMYKKVKRDDS